MIAVVAVAAGGREGSPRRFFADLRAGLRRGEDRPGFFADLRSEVRAVEEESDTTVDDLFRIGSTQGPAYLDAERLTAPVERATQRLVPRQRSRDGASVGQGR